MKILIKNGEIVNSDSSSFSDVLISDGVIIKVGKNLQTKYKTDKIIDATGLYLFPGGIDPHVHMELPTSSGPSSDDFFTGSRAALYGGTTTIIDFVTPNRGQSLTEALELRKREAAKSVVNYSFHVSPVEWLESTENEIRNIFSHEGINSFKVYMAYKNSVGLDDSDLFQVMKAVSKVGGIVTLHCELGDEIELLREKFANSNLPEPKAHLLSRPPEMESKAVKKAIELGKEAGCKIYIVHVSSKKSLEHIAKAQKEGQIVYAETCPQYLLLDQSEYDKDFENGSAFIMSPPLRSKADNDALWVAVSNDVIQSMGTDHCPFMLSQKQLGKNDFRKIPNGAGGVEHRMSLLFTYGVLQDRISLNRFVEITSTNPAKIFGLFPDKGQIVEGADADIIIWNPEKENLISVENHHQNCDLEIYDGFKTKGVAEFVILNGEIVLNNGILYKNLHKGKFLKRN